MSPSAASIVIQMSHFRSKIVSCTQSIKTTKYCNRVQKQKRIFCQRGRKKPCSTFIYRLGPKDAHEPTDCILYSKIFPKAISCLFLAQEIRNITKCKGLEHRKPVCQQVK